MDFDLDSFIGREITCNIQLDAGQIRAAGPPGIGRPCRRGRATDQCPDHRRACGARRAATFSTSSRCAPGCTWPRSPPTARSSRTRPCADPGRTAGRLRLSRRQAPDRDLPASAITRPSSTRATSNSSSRLCQEWGISYFFEHSEGKHRLVLIDNMGAYKKNDSAAYQQVEYHAPGWKVDAEYVHSFVPHTSSPAASTPAATTTTPAPRADLSVGRSDPRPRARPTARSTNGTQRGRQPLRAAPRGQGRGQRPAGRRPPVGAAAHAGPAHPRRRAQASGNLRGMVPGCSFQLQKHPRQKANAEYLILDTRLLIEDVAQDSQIVARARSQAALEGGGRLHRASDHRAAAPGADAGQALHARPAVRAGGRPRRPEHLDRRTGPHQGAVPLGPHRPEEDQHSTCWIRVSSPWAGNQLGGMQIPRIGQEVIVDFYRRRPGPADLHGACTTRRTCRPGHCRASRRCRASGAGS
jgi:type VI secretion system secreted protein VgrG